MALTIAVRTFWTSAAPAMTCPRRASEWHPTPTMTTAIFAVFPIGVVLLARSAHLHVQPIFLAAVAAAAIDLGAAAIASLGMTATAFAALTAPPKPAQIRNVPATRPVAMPACYP